MLRLPAIIVAVLSLSLVMACAPVAEKLSPTAAPATSAPKSAPPPASVATPQPAAEKPQKGGTLNYALAGEPGELDPIKIASTPSRQMYVFMFNTLVNVDGVGNIVPELAESWSITPDNNTYVFKLRKGVKFHDGTDFNAQAVKFNYERVLDPASKATTTAKGFYENVRSVDVLDDYTVRFNLKTPQAAISFLPQLTGYSAAMFSPAAAKKWGDDAITHPVGTGPFELVEWVKGDHITLKRFDGYWRKDEYGAALPYLDGIIVKPIPDSSVMLTNLRTGALDLMADVSEDQMPLVEREKGLKTVSYAGTRASIRLNCVAPPFNNRALRQAVAWTIDREAISKALYGGVGLGEYLLSPKSWAFDPSGKFYTRDLAKTKAKLLEAGKPDGFKFTALVINVPIGTRLAQAVKSQLAEAGIDMEIVPVEDRVRTAQGVAGKFEAIIEHATPSLVSDNDYTAYKMYHSEGGSNYGKCSNPETDKLIESLGAYDKDAAKPIFAKVQALVLDESYDIYLHEGPSTAAMGQRVMGFKPPLNVYYIQWDGVWIKE